MVKGIITRFFVALSFILTVAWFSIQPAVAQALKPTHPVHIYIFWGNGCPHCAEARPFLADLVNQYPQIRLHEYEVWYDQDNQKLFSAMATAYGFEPHGVPTIFIGDLYWEGYTDAMGEAISQAVTTCLADGCKNAGLGIIPGITPDPIPTNPTSASGSAAGNLGNQAVEIPLIGSVSLEHQSLLVSTLLISFVDGINPCSVWVLTMLLAITLHTGSRKKVLLIGLIFLTVTAGVYALFIAGLFTIFSIVNFVGWIQIVVALVALLFGFVNIKDYFWYKEGVSLTIADEKKPGLLQRMRALVNSSQSLGGLVGATIVLAAGVSLVEFSCTAGFPVLWTNLLSAQKVGAVSFILLLFVYLLIYQLDEMVIFFSAVYTLKAAKLEEKHGRLLKLIGGMLMLTLAVVMIINPALMNSLSSSLLVFGIAATATALILLVHRILLPHFGVWIGNEKHHRRSHSRRG